MNRVFNKKRTSNRSAARSKWYSREFLHIESTCVFVWPMTGHVVIRFAHVLLSTIWFASHIPKFELKIANNKETYNRLSFKFQLLFSPHYFRSDVCVESALLIRRTKRNTLTANAWRMRRAKMRSHSISVSQQIANNIFGVNSNFTSHLRW